MSKNSEAVKRWRQNCKARIITAMGGKCCICGYNKCQAALALHHLDPQEKDFAFGKIRANPKSWNKIVKELRKCALLCHNCHSEVHAGIAVVPANAPRFDEDYKKYKNFIMSIQNTLTPCVVCKKLKPCNLKTCSRSCSATLSCKVDWLSVNLETELQSKSIIQIAKELGCSDSAVNKRLKKLGLK